MRLIARIALACLVLVTLPATLPADDAGQDRLAMLYSSGFAFTSDGLPILNVMLMEGEPRVELSAEGGLDLLPQGDGGARIQAGARWTIHAEDTRPARMRFWTVVSREGTGADIARWKKRGFDDVRLFETGLVFGMKGRVLDSRRMFVAVAPEDSEQQAQARAARIATEQDVETFVHPEMLARPQGTLVARRMADGEPTIVRVPQVLWLAPRTADGVVTVQNVPTGHGGSQQAGERQSRRYAGRMVVTLDWDGRLTVVNQVAVDRLLMGTVPAEMFPSAPMAALEAQAVAARDELFSRIGTRDFEKPYVTCASQRCQVYGGVDAEHPETTRAVQNTRGQVLFRAGKSELVPAYYSAACGGHSENNETIWGTPPDVALRGKLDARGIARRALAPFASGITDANLAAFLAQAPRHAYCHQTRYGKGRARWQLTRTGADLDALVARVAPGVGHVTGLRPLERGVSGRIARLEVTGTGGTTVLEGDLHIRRSLGGLRSTLFQVTHKNDTWLFDGAGFGHGVGMCQVGAIAMAEAGLPHTTILPHYYKGAQVKRLY